jgi:4-amino-4-deoxy-L-arabinose transferase-like glycosyltransferase
MVFTEDRTAPVVETDTDAGSATPPAGIPHIRAAGRPRRWYLHPPRLVLVATVTFVALTGFWSVLTPLTEAPDEPAHLGLVLRVADTGRYPAYDGLVHTKGLFQLCMDYAASAKWCATKAERDAEVGVRPHPAAAAPPKDQRAHWDDADFQEIEPGRLNQMPQHPPVYYLAMAEALRVERAVVPGDHSVDQELAFLRMLNVLLVLPLPYLAWLLVRRLGGGDELGILAALVPLGVPQLTHIGATLNNDNLFVVVVSWLMALLAGVARGDRTRRTMVLVGLALGLALLTKGFGVVLPPVVVLAYWVGTPAAPATESDRRLVGWLRRGWAATPAALGALVVGFVLSGWWYLNNLRRTGRIMPSIEDARLNVRNRLVDYSPTVWEYVSSTVSRLVEGFWGSFGWRRVMLPPMVSTVATLTCLFLMYVAIRRAPRSSADPEQPLTRARLGILILPVVALGAFVIIRAAVIYQDTGRLAFQQGRYLFAGLTATSAVVALGIRHLCGRRALTVTLVGVVVLQGLAIVWCIRGWWRADGLLGLGPFREIVAWSGLPDLVVVAVLVWLPLQLLILVRASLRSSGADDGSMADLVEA